MTAKEYLKDKGFEDIELWTERSPVERTELVSSIMTDYAQHVCKDKKNNIEERGKRFRNLILEVNCANNILLTLEVFNTNGKSFIEYWTEHGENDRKMRFEKETSFDIKKRLLRWKNYNYNKNGSKNNSYYDKYPDLFNKDGTPKIAS